MKPFAGTVSAAHAVVDGSTSNTRAKAAIRSE